MVSFSVTSCNIAIINRITLHSESARQMLTREFVFEPVDALLQRESGTEPVLLRARKEMLEPNAKWYGAVLCMKIVFTHGLPSSTM